MLRAVVGAILLLHRCGLCLFLLESRSVWTISIRITLPLSTFAAQRGTAGQPAAPAGGIVTTDKAAATGGARASPANLPPLLSSST